MNGAAGKVCSRNVTESKKCQGYAMLSLFNEKLSKRLDKTSVIPVLTFSQANFIQITLFPFFPQWLQVTAL